ncbi:integrase [Xenorhabdus cabanillasii JM26]|nr:integrase [Xenorhabdus cabanillasii JM26]
MLIIPPTSRNERRQMKKIIQKTSDKNYARRMRITMKEVR